MSVAAQRRSIIRAHCPELEVCEAEDVLASHGADWTRFHVPDPAAVVFPRTAEEVCRLVRTAAAHAIPLVPSGGRTGLSGGAVAARQEIVVSFDRMRRILDFDPVDRILRVEAGVVTAAVQDRAREEGLYYPVSFGAEGSAQIGGNIATNAGGIRVLRYGLTRHHVAGLKVVDGRGDLLELNAELVKNASGYDLRHLMIGSEGTLGMVVEASLWLTGPPPPSRVVLLGVRDLPGLLRLLRSARASLALSAFEFMSRAAVQRVCAARQTAPPLAPEPPFYALLEFDCPPESATRVEAGLLKIFEDGRRDGALLDAVISGSAAQDAALWALREGISEAIDEHTPYKNDLSVRPSRMPDYLARLEALVDRLFPAFEVLWYGHIGDGNLHLNILKPAALEPARFERTCQELGREIYTVTRDYGGSVSAEHGIGLLKQPFLHFCRSAAEIERMRDIKAVFDPAGILNPGKLLGEAEAQV